jgi:hypothetical protein
MYELPTLEELTRDVMAHWREHRPKMAQSYGNPSELHKAAKAEAQATLQAAEDLIASGMPGHEAWSLVREQVFLPSEEEVPELGQEMQPYAEGWLLTGDEEESEQPRRSRSRPDDERRGQITSSPMEADPWVQAAQRRSTGGM